MEAFEFTLLKCFIHRGLVIDVAPVHRRIEIDASGGGLVEAVIEARHEVVSETDEQSSFGVDRILGFEGHIQPQLTPKAFEAAKREYPHLVAGTTERFFPTAGPASTRTRRPGRAKSKSPKAFRYRTVEAGVGDADGLELMTVLLKDHFGDGYRLDQLMVDHDTRAASILQFLAETTDGRFQPVAGFAGIVKELAPADSAISSPDDQTRKPIMDPFGRVLASLLEAALVRQGFLADVPTASPEHGLKWLANLLRSRAVIALETDLPFAEQTIARTIQQHIGLPLVTAEPISPTEPILNLVPLKQPSFVLLPMTAYARLADPERIGYELTSGDHAVLVGCNSIRSLPEPLRRIVETTVTLPRIDRPIFERVFTSVFGVSPPKEEKDGESATWVHYIQPWDLARIARSKQDPRRAYVMLRHRIEDRLGQLTPRHGASLGDLYGLGEARIRAEMLVADIKAAMAGRIAWSEVDRGMLLVGPPGCGKTALARAIAKDCGIHFLDCSAARWQMAGYLNEHLAAMARDFQEARRFAPSIMFIDEIDSIGSRESFTGNNASYSTQVVNALLAELQGFSERGQVILIAATNDPDHVDPALKRAGRLDRVVRVTLPNIDALEKIFEHYLSVHGSLISPPLDLALRPVAEAAFGRTGADVNLAVRGALRRARLAGRQLCQDDLLAELFNRPLDRDLARPLQGEGIRRVALHEAGHTVVRLRLGGAFCRIGFISIIPRPDGSLGFISLQPNPNVSTLSRMDYLALLDITLGGRAAEGVFYGAEEVGASAGGGRESDLATATAIAIDMICRLGLGRSMKLHWREIPTTDDCKEAEELIAEAYDRVKELIIAQRGLLERIAEALIERQELSGEELRLLVGEDAGGASRDAGVRT